ncbi:uncharacterized protein LOC141707872 [Apium graveolens]|uniref:uncharacterized protein LOC141707872 n=1 Tax=Apium graveolens TaxID=4045 RepID=UPI003D7AA8C5
MTMDRKHPSTIANDVLLRCSQKLDISLTVMVEEFESTWTPENGDYSRKLVEYWFSRALNDMCCTNIQEQISDGSFSRFSFDMMLAWEKPGSTDDQHDSFSESIAKEKEEEKVPTNLNPEDDEIPLFYSDLMPLLVDDGPSVGEGAFVWLATVAPIIADVVNGKFTFETLTAKTLNRLHYPAYNIFIQQIDRCIKQLQRQNIPSGVELADDEFILHVEGTASTSRVVRHIGGASWPGRLTLTNYALYFEASGVLAYEEALKLDLSKRTDKSVKPAATGPWGAPLFDKAITYESPDLEESIVLEFPEMKSSTRRDHWLALVKEVLMLHFFLLKFKVTSPLQVWEMHARTILGIVRLHAAREMLRTSAPAPKSFLIFSLLEVLPKGDIVLEELAKCITNITGGQSCSASSILRNLNVTQACAPSMGDGEIAERIETLNRQAENLSSLESAIDQVREEAKESGIAKATVEGLKEEGVSDSAAVLKELLKPINTALWPWFQEVFTWKKPETTVVVIGLTLLIIYKEWIGIAIAALLLWLVGKMMWVRWNRIGDKYDKLVVCTASDKSAVESMVSAQHGLLTASEMLRLANISILKAWSIFFSKAPKHTDMVMMAMTGLAIFVAVIPFKFILMVLVLCLFTATSKLKKRANRDQGNKGSRRLKEWWDSIPVIPVEILDKLPEDTR